jgi:hypothetical protein
VTLALIALLVDVVRHHANRNILHDLATRSPFLARAAPPLLCSRERERHHAVMVLMSEEKESEAFFREAYMSHEGKKSSDADVLEGRYANAFRVGHNAFEFVLDFGQAPLDSEQARFHTRIIAAPVYAKAFFEILRESLTKYEQTFAAIPHGEQTEEDTPEGSRNT